MGTLYPLTRQAEKRDWKLESLKLERENRKYLQTDQKLAL